MKFSFIHTTRIIGVSKWRSVRKYHAGFGLIRSVSEERYYITKFQQKVVKSLVGKKLLMENVLFSFQREKKWKAVLKYTTFFLLQILKEKHQWVIGHSNRHRWMKRNCFSCLLIAFIVNANWWNRSWTYLLESNYNFELLYFLHNVIRIQTINYKKHMVNRHSAIFLSK